jgi:glucosamine-phosphate N-acetyltransferase
MPMRDLTIRDLDVADLENGFLETLAFLSEVNLTPQEARPLLEDRCRAGVQTFVAVRGGRVVGTASLVAERKFIHAGGRVGHVEDVAVHRDFQRRGIGTKLVVHAVKRAQALGCYKVILDCFGPVAPFYSRLGFREFNRGLRLDLPVDL